MQRNAAVVDLGGWSYNPMPDATDMTIEILQQIRADIQGVHRSLSNRIDGLETRMTTVEYTLRGLATDVQQIPELVRLVRQVADHEARITRLES